MIARAVAAARVRAVAATCLATVAGGMLDAWSYTGHGGVFANAQTGNVVVIAADLAGRRPGGIAGPALSFAAFVAGLLASRLWGRMLRRRGRNSRSIRLWLTAALLAALGSVSAGLTDTGVTASIGFIAAILMTSLSHIGNWSFNTGMTTGNMRAAATALADVTDGDARAWPRIRLMLAICLAFALGAYVGALATPALGGGTALLAAAAIALAAVILNRDPDPLPAWEKLGRRPPLSPPS